MPLLIHLGDYDVLTTGGGAIEMELSKYLRDHARTIAGKEQLLISCMAKALEVIPRQLCDNAGFDATNILNKLRQKHAQGECPIVISVMSTSLHRAAENEKQKYKNLNCEKANQTSQKTRQAHKT